MVPAAETISDLGQAGVGEFPSQVHGQMTGLHDRAGTLDRLDLGYRDSRRVRTTPKITSTVTRVPAISGMSLSTSRARSTSIGRLG